MQLACTLKDWASFCVQYWPLRIAEKALLKFCFQFPVLSPKFSLQVNTIIMVINVRTVKETSNGALKIENPYHLNHSLEFAQTQSVRDADFEANYIFLTIYMHYFIYLKNHWNEDNQILLTQIQSCLQRFEPLDQLEWLRGSFPKQHCWKCFPGPPGQILSKIN